MTNASPAPDISSRPDGADEPVTCELGYAPSDVVDALLRGVARLRRHLIITQELRSGSRCGCSDAPNGQRQAPAATPIRTSGAQWYYTDEGQPIGTTTDQR